MQVPLLDDLSLYTSKAETGVLLPKAMKKKLISSPRVCQFNQLVEKAHPSAQGMEHLKPSLTREFFQYVSFKVSFTLKVVVFIVWTVFHLVFLYIYHLFNLASHIFPKKTSFRRKSIKPVLQVTNEFPAELSTKLSKRYELVFQKTEISSEVPQALPRAPLQIPSVAPLQSSSSKPGPSDPYYPSSRIVIVSDQKLPWQKMNILLWTKLLLKAPSEPANS